MSIAPEWRMLMLIPIRLAVDNSVGVDVLEDVAAFDEPKDKRKSIGPSTFTVPLPTLLVAAMPRKIVEVRSAPMTVDLMSMFFMVPQPHHRSRLVGSKITSATGGEEDLHGA